MATKPTAVPSAVKVVPLAPTGIRQTIIFTALPNGIADGKVRLSVYISPRLEAPTGTTAKLTLGTNYSDWVDWPTQAAALSFDVFFDGKQATPATRVPAPVSPAPADPTKDPSPSEIWSTLFPAGTWVKPYEFQDLATREFRFFPVQNVHNRLREVYQVIAWESPTKVPGLVGEQKVPRLQDFLSQIAVTPAQRPAVTEQITSQFQQSALKTMRVEPYTPSTVAPRFMPGMTTHAGVAAGAAILKVPAIKARPIAGMVAPLPQAAVEFHMAKVFHERPEMAAMMARPKPFNETADFHQIVSTLGQYPDLLRRVGLVIDLEIPVASVPPGAKAVWVVPHWTPKVSALSNNPKTACVFGAGKFVAAPKLGDSDMANGMLKLNDPTRFEIGQMDLDGSALKTLAVAEQYMAYVAPPAAALHAAVPKLAKPAAIRAPVAAKVAPVAAAGLVAQLEQTTLPSMRSAGLWVAQVDRAAKLKTYLADVVAPNQNAVANNKANSEVLLYAEDLARGYRVDVWDATAAKWFSLCRRVGTYSLSKLTKSFAADDEGWVSTGASHSTTPDAPMYLHEVLFRWEGWGFCVPRPGQAIAPGGVPQDTGVPFGVDIAFDARPGSFPRLRFGHEYRLRARVVDLAGNSLPDTSTDDSLATLPITYFRHEPISPPALIPRKDLSTPATPGESVEHMVIHSFNDAPAKDAQPTAEKSERNAAAPKVAELMAETHGKFDGPAGVKGDPATFNIILTHDGDFPGYLDAPKLPMPYLADPLATNATLRLLYTHWLGGPAEQVKSLPFTGPWPDLDSFRIVAYEPTTATTELQIDPAARVVSVPLAKASTAELVVSCALAEADLQKHSIWRLTVEKPVNPAMTAKPGLLPAQALQIHREMSQPGGVAKHAATLGLATLDVQKIGQLATQATRGLNWMITPYRTILLVHAVQQPLITPDISKIAAYRQLGQTYVRLVDEFPISGKSTEKVALTAHWDEYLDILTEPKWHTKPAKGAVFEFPVKPEDTKVAFQSPLASSPLVGPMPEDTRTRHEFGDTKRRQVYYTCTATTRFREYFTRAIANDPTFKITRESPEQMLDVPSAARPAALKLLYVVPTFTWTRDPAKLTSFRSGGGLRVYMYRPWFSSGVGERLGVVLQDQSKGSMPSEKLLPFITQWGADPIWVSPKLAEFPGTSDFTNMSDDGAADGLTLDEMGSSYDQTVSVAGHPVFYDEQRQLWYADLDINPGESYMPFIKLVLARFQPNSVKQGSFNCHLSRCVRADFAQLIPGRFASVTRADAKTLVVSVSGPAYTASKLSQSSSNIQVSVEKKLPNIPEPLCWVPASDQVFRLSRSFGGTRLAAAATPTLPKVKAPAAGVAKPPVVRPPVVIPRLTLGKTWTGRVLLPDAPGPFRIVIKEYEVLRVDERWTQEPGPPPTLAMVPAPVEGRLVYAETMPVS
jgi:hypothetical protein